MSCLVRVAADMRSATGSQVDFQPRFDKFFRVYTTKLAQRILQCREPIARCRLLGAPSAAQSVADAVGYALLIAFGFVFWEFVLPVPPTSTFLNATTTLVTCA